jgi:hypothetical protein
VHVQLGKGSRGRCPVAVDTRSSQPAAIRGCTYNPIVRLLHETELVLTQFLCSYCHCVRGGGTSPKGVSLIHPQDSGPSCNRVAVGTDQDKLTEPSSKFENIWSITKSAKSSSMLM